MKLRTKTVCIRYWCRGPAPGVIVWLAIWYTIRSSLVWNDCNFNADWCISEILQLVVAPYLVEACQRPSSSKIEQDHMLHVAFCIPRYTGLFDCCSVLHNL